MENVVLFGAGGTAERIIGEIRGRANILFATDNDENRYGQYICGDVPVKDKNELYKGGFDRIIIASINGLNEISYQLIHDFGIKPDVIVRKFVENTVNARIQFLESFAQIVYKNYITGSIAEVGVFRGEFAKVMNKQFFDRKCYLFDTFEGFDERDFTGVDGQINYKPGMFSNTKVQLVLEKLPNLDNCVIKKGYFPDTFDLPENELFCFVHLDADLYMPIKAGLEIFYPRMVKGGIISIHDYFDPNYPGPMKAVDEFVKKTNLSVFPIGDGISIGLMKI